MQKNLKQIIIEAFSPRERESPVEWAEKHFAEIPYSNVPGKFSSKGSPMLREVMETICSRRVRKIIVSACVQSGKTLAPELCLGYLIANAPAPAVWLNRTDEDAKDQAEGRLHPLFEACEPIKKLFPADKNKKRIKTILFTNGMTLWVLGANNETNLQRRSICYVFGDETWQWKPGRMKEAEARTTAFGYRSKCVFMSQGSVAGDDTDREFCATDKREWSFQCPHCKTIQPFDFRNLKWDKTAKNKTSGEWNFARVRESIKLACQACAAEFEDNNETRRRLSENARFVPTNNNPLSGCVGFHWNALAMNNTTWGELAEEYIMGKKAMKRGNPDPLKVFYQKRLALPWGHDETSEQLVKITQISSENYRFGDAWDEEAVFDNDKKTWVTLGEFNAVCHQKQPAARLRFLTVDVQEAHYYYVVRAWSKTGNSRLVARGMTMDTDVIEAARVEHGVKPEVVFYDAHYKTMFVKNLCAAYGYACFMGDARTEFSHGKEKKPYSKPVTYTGTTGKKTRVFYFSNRSVKDTLALIRSGQTNVKWGIPEDIDVAYLKQINAEYFDEKKQAWVCAPSRDNHFFDCETMQISAALMHGLIG